MKSWDKRLTGRMVHGLTCFINPLHPYTPCVSRPLKNPTYLPRTIFTSFINAMKGVWVDGATQTLKGCPIPEPGEGQVLIEVMCTAPNPKDWKGMIHCVSHSVFECRY